MSGYSIRYASSDDVEGVHAFHVANAGEYVWPRTLEELRQMVIDRSVFVVETDGTVVGMAYTRRDPPRWEFGGAFVDNAHRNNGLAGGLSRVALTAHFSAENPPLDEPLIAHVHEFNPSNIREVLGKLGFERTGRETPPPEIAPRTMKRNHDGQVVGELYTFRCIGLERLVTWLGDADSRYAVDVAWFDRDELRADLCGLLEDCDDERWGQ